MAFTAQLGIAAAYPSNIVPGLGSGDPPVEAGGTWELIGAASGSLVVPTAARATALNASAIVSAADRQARATALNASAIVSAADHLARSTALNGCIIYQPLTSRSTWQFGGVAYAAKALAAGGTWELWGHAIGLVDSIHVGEAETAWELKGEATGRITGTATGEPAGVWEFGGSVVVAEGTPEECITGDGKAEADDFTVDSNYVF